MAPNSSQEAVREQFESNQVVLLGERHGIAQNLEFIVSLIPHLWSNGVRNIALEFFAAENQADSDRHLSSREFDEQAVRDLLFAYNVGWPFLEYQSVHQAVWHFNRTNNASMRVVHPSYIYDWSKWLGIRNDESMQGVLHKGNVNEYRASVIADSVNRGEKLLGLFGAVHAVKDQRRLVEMGFGNFRSLGDILEQDYSLTVSSINLNHALSASWDVEIKTADELTPCSIDYEFLVGRDFAQVLTSWPDPDWQAPPHDELEYWQIIESRRASFVSI